MLWMGIFCSVSHRIVNGSGQKRGERQKPSLTEIENLVAALNLGATVNIVKRSKACSVTKKNMLYRWVRKLKLLQTLIISLAYTASTNNSEVVANLSMILSWALAVDSSILLYPAKFHLLWLVAVSWRHRATCPN